MEGVESNNQNTFCVEVFQREITNSLNKLRMIAESQLKPRDSWGGEMFQCGDPDFYKYKYLIDKQECITQSLLFSISIGLMDIYGIPYEIIDSIPGLRVKGFFLESNNRRIGYSFSEFNSSIEVDKVISRYSLYGIICILCYTDSTIIDNANKGYLKKQDNRRYISLQDFFSLLFNIEEYNLLINYMDKYVSDAKEIIGYKSIRFLSPINFAEQKKIAEKTLCNMDYTNQAYQIIANNNRAPKCFLNISNYSFPSNIAKIMVNNYLSKSIYRTMIGGNDYAESFITSEWLFKSIEDNDNYDYTAIISGYLKSIEQLLYSIVMLNVDNNCRIVINKADGIPDAIKQNSIPVYYYDKNKNGRWKKGASDKLGKYPYMDFTSITVSYMDNSIGTFEYFLRYNPHIFVDPNIAETVADMISCFRIECRNGYFHTHNLHNWDVVKKTRSNAIYLYYVLLGGCIIPQSKYELLGFQNQDGFDRLCIKIREFRNYGIDFIFEYKNGVKRKLVYDIKCNTANYNDNGIEHYEYLTFHEVENFTDEEYLKIDEGLVQNRIIRLTRDTIPTRIIGIRHKKQEDVLFPFE